MIIYLPFCGIFGLEENDFKIEMVYSWVTQYNLPIRVSLSLYINWLVFYSISTIISYLMLNPDDEYIFNVYDL